MPSEASSFPNYAIEYAKTYVKAPIREANAVSNTAPLLLHSLIDYSLTTPAFGVHAMDAGRRKS